MNIALTGSLGHISQPLTQALLQQGHAVTVISSNPDKRPAIQALGAQAAIGRIDDVDFLTATFGGKDAVYCMLPPFNYLDPALDLMAQTRQLIGGYCQAIRNTGVKQVVHLSSIGAHTDQGNGALAFHHLAEQRLQELPPDVIIKHVRPAGFYTNLYDYTTMIQGKGFGAIYLTIRYGGLGNLLTGKRGIIAANYGGDDVNPWASPKDIAAAIAEELTTPFTHRSVRYVASEELTCDQVAKIIGAAIGKPYLKWALMSDQAMLSGLTMVGMPQANAQSLVQMNAGMHSGLVNQDYYRHRPVLGKVKLAEFAQEFATSFVR